MPEAIAEGTPAKNMMAALNQPSGRRSTEGFPGIRKAAILCMALGDEVASLIFKHLDEDEVQAITRELALLHRVSSEMADDVIEEFYQLMLARTFVVSGGVEYAKRLLVKTFGPEVAKRLLDKITRSMESTAGFEALQKVDP